MILKDHFTSQKKKEIPRWSFIIDILIQLDLWVLLEISLCKYSCKTEQIGRFN